MSDITEQRKQRLQTVLSKRQPDLTLVLANIHDPHNVSAIYRSCDAFGLNTVHLYYPDMPFPKLSQKSSASASKWLNTMRHNNFTSLHTALKNYTVLVTACTPTAHNFRQWDYTRPTAIIMGNEHSGVPEELLALATEQIYIPMYGMIQSFNVSVAAALILAEVARQREIAGLYDHCRLPQTLFQAQFAQWLEK